MEELLYDGPQNQLIELIVNLASIDIISNDVSYPFEGNLIEGNVGPKVQRTQQGIDCIY